MKEKLLEKTNSVVSMKEQEMKEAESDLTELADISTDIFLEKLKTGPKSKRKKDEKKITTKKG